jgi:membrane-associated protease RseP (regulator of RpoE activity)
LSSPLDELIPVNENGHRTQMVTAVPDRRTRRRLIIQVLLFVLTILSTAVRGGWAYSGSLILILLFHEMGHYFAARYYNVPATLPYFIPDGTLWSQLVLGVPLGLFGTFGAVIKIQGIIPNRRALFDIGIMGPAMGLVVALPATVVGIAMSKVIQVNQLPEGTFGLGDSILFSLIAHWIHGPLPKGHDLLLHPIAFAGWAGLFVTALNLLPMGQLDGGHIVYALFQKKSAFVYRLVFFCLAMYSLVARQPQWIFFLALTFFLIRLRHPPTIDEEIPIGRRRFAFGIAAMLFLAITFPPNPIKLDF